MSSRSTSYLSTWERLIMKAHVITSPVVLMLQDAKMQSPLSLWVISSEEQFFEFIQENIQLFQICNLVNECVPHSKESMVDGEPVYLVMHYGAVAKKKKSLPSFSVMNARLTEWTQVLGSHRLWNSLKLAKKLSWEPLTDIKGIITLGF